MNDTRTSFADGTVGPKWVGGAAGLLVVGGLAAWAIAPVTFDDAFISFRYARHLVEGHGLVFNPGEYVEGYTNFLWVMLSAAALRAGVDPLLASRALGLAGYLACILMAWWTARALVARATRSRAVAILWLVAVLVVSRGVARLAGSGLETFFVTACLLATGVVFHLRAPSRVGEWGWSMLPLAAVLTRMDAVLGIAASLLATCVRTDDRGDLWPTMGRRYAAPALGLGVLVAWRLSYYGDLVPNSYHAKDAGGWHVGAGLAYVGGYLLNSPSVVVLAGLAAAGLRAAWRTSSREWQVFLCAFVVLHTAYAVKVGGDFMYYRFMFEALPFLVCAAIVGLALARFRDERTAVLVAASCLVLSVTPRYLEESYGMQSLWEMNAYAERGREVGERLREVLPPETRIATTLAGTIPYYSRLFAVDQWGLNDATVAKQLPPRRFHRGHVKSASIDHLFDRHVNLIVDHPTVCSCAEPCGQGRPHVFIRLSGDRCLRTTYLVQTVALTQHVCSNPEDFVLQNVSCQG